MSLTIQLSDARQNLLLARRKDIYKKSKYYQEKRQKLLIATGIGIFVLVFILILARYPRMQQLYEFQTGSSQKNCFHERF